MVMKFSYGATKTPISEYLDKLTTPNTDLSLSYKTDFFLSSLVFIPLLYIYLLSP